MQCNDNKNSDYDCIMQNTFYILLTVLAAAVSNTLMWPEHNRVQITCNTLSAFHVQHIMCHMVEDSSAIKFDRI